MRKEERTIKTKYAAWIMVLIMVIAALAGCGSAGKEQTGDQSGEAGQEPSASVELTTPSGVKLTLTHVSADDFKAQDDGVIVNTRIGTTVHKSGSQFTEGSGLSLSNMRNTEQYEKPMVAFTYEVDGGGDPADAIGEIGETTKLIIDGNDYSVDVAWITDEMGCFIFDCDEIPETDALFIVEDGSLRITP